MAKYVVIAEYEDSIEGTRKKAGDVIDIDDARAKVLANIGVIAADEPDESGLIHLGGGYYQLPNGEKVRGKQNALDALKSNKPPDESATDNDKNQTNESEQQPTDSSAQGSQAPETK